MPGNANRTGARVRLGAALTLLLLAAGCSGGGSMFGGPSPPASTAPPPAAPAPSRSNWLPSDISNFFSGSSATAPQAVAGATPDVECPYIEIRTGASTLTISVPGDNSAMSLKYQGTFVRAARQCSVVNGQMVLKVGVEGRLILGPAGVPGEVTVPLRIAVVDTSLSGSKTIVTKLITIPVQVASVDDNPVFSHVEDGLTFPLPPEAQLDHYIIYIGFDPLAVEAHAKHEKPVRHRKPKPRPAPAPGTN